jgi:hypothetical protein
MDLNSLISILLGGMAAGMVLFIVSVGLSVTMGLMGSNLAHGGLPCWGYAIVLSMTHWGLPFCRARVWLRRGRRDCRNPERCSTRAVRRERARPGAVHDRTETP